MDSIPPEMQPVWRTLVRPVRPADNALLPRPRLMFVILTAIHVIALLSSRSRIGSSLRQSSTETV